MPERKRRTLNVFDFDRPHQVVEANNILSRNYLPNAAGPDRFALSQATILLRQCVYKGHRMHPEGEDLIGSLEAKLEKAFEMIERSENESLSALLIQLAMAVSLYKNRFLSNK